MAQMGKWGCSQQTDLRASTKALQGASGAKPRLPPTQTAAPAAGHTPITLSTSSGTS